MKENEMMVETRRTSRGLEAEGVVAGKRKRPIKFEQDLLVGRMKGQKIG
jgi:hypothetical protein